MGKGKAIAVLIISRNKTTRYESITEASRDTGISEACLKRALYSKSGEIPKRRPVLCIDYVFGDEGD